MKRLLLAILGVIALATAAQAEQSCDANVPAITSGYGADGPNAIDMRSVDNPAFRRKPVMVFLPRQVTAPAPVIFFSHGYGPGDWNNNATLLNHAASLGYVVVFSGYPMIRADNDERYDSLWQGFVAAANAFGNRMDLTRVGFVGHSFGGGATPALVQRAIAQKGWGAQGIFMMELAPWYSFQASNTKLRQFPAQVVHLVQTYDKDTVNDHRMAIDLFNSIAVKERYFFQVQSQIIAGCELTADHATPGINHSARLKQYGVLKPFDALADAVFNKSQAARTALAGMGSAPAAGGYQPLVAQAQPTPPQPEKFYRYAWGDRQNPRR